MVAEQPQRDTVSQLAVPVDEFGVGIDVAFPGTLDEVGVVDLCCHRRSRAAPLAVMASHAQGPANNLRRLPPECV
jgi:hypothetical protein